MRWHTNDRWYTAQVKDWATEEVEAKPERRPTMTAVLYVVGSPCIELFLESIYVSLRNGPPTRAPVATLGFGSVESRYFQPSLQLVSASLGMEAPLW